MNPVTRTRLMLFFVLTFCPQIWAAGFEFLMNRPEQQLLCEMVTDPTDKSYIVDISITDLSEDKFILASASICQPDLYVPTERNISIEVTGSISQHQAKIDIRFNTESKCKSGTYMCEVTFRNSEGHLDRKHEILEAKIPDVISSKQADFSDAMFSAQVKELQDTIAESVSLVKNLSAGFEEKLVNLINRVEYFEQSSANTTLLLEKFYHEIQDAGKLNPAQTNDSLAKKVTEDSLSSGGRTIAFSAGMTATQNLAVNNKVVYDKVFSNVGNGYDQNTGIFTAPVNGLYVCTTVAFAGKDKEFWLMMSQKPISAESARHLVSVYGKTPFYTTASNTVVQELEQGDKVYIHVERASELYNADGVYNTFSCVLQASDQQFLHG